MDGHPKIGNGEYKRIRLNHRNCFLCAKQRCIAHSGYARVEFLPYLRLKDLS